MIATITDDGFIVFDLNKTDPWDWINMITSAFPGSYIACYGQYDNAIKII